MKGNLLSFGVTSALICLAPGLQAQAQPERPRLDPSWTDAPEPNEDPDAASDAQRSAAPPAAVPAPQLTQPAPPPLPPPQQFPVPSAWSASEAWFRVELSGDDPQTRFKIYSLAKDADKKVPIHGCANPCRVLLPRGEYRVNVSGNPEHVEGDRKFELTADSRLRFSLPDRSARTTGLVLGISGSALVGVGMLVLLFSSWGGDCMDSCGPGQRNARTETYVGLGMLLTGAVLTPIGWVQFGRNRKPRVEQQPLGGAPREATAPRFGIAFSPVAGGAAAGVSASF